MYELTKELETGNTIIDNEHRELIKAINNLLDACSKGQGRAQIESTMEFLKNYTSQHFAHEEQLQLKSKYPDYKNHKQYHEGFKRVVSDIEQQFKSEGPSIVLVGKVNSSIAGWLLNHIKREDKKVAAHIKSIE